MKKNLIFLCLIVIAGYILCCPTDAVTAAAKGLLLWYERVLPALLPFAILSNILIDSNYLHCLTRPLHKIVHPILPVSEAGSFVLLSGFLFGFPMGSKNCAALLKKGALSEKEAQILLSITNNISPVFISGYILMQELKLPSLTLFTFLVLYLPPLVVGSFRLRKTDTTFSSQKKPASDTLMNFKIIDAGIMNGFETLTRLGGYIMMFSIIASMTGQLPLSQTGKALLAGLTEITNGIHVLISGSLPMRICYPLAMMFTAFGGLSGVAQTSSMIQGSGLSLRPYLKEKMLFSAMSALLAILVVKIVGL